MLRRDFGLFLVPRSLCVVAMLVEASVFRRNDVALDGLRCHRVAVTELCEAVLTEAICVPDNPPNVDKPFRTTALVKIGVWNFLRTPDHVGTLEPVIQRRVLLILESTKFDFCMPAYVTCGYSTRVANGYMPHNCRPGPPRIYAARVYGQVGSFHYFESLLGRIPQMSWPRQSRRSCRWTAYTSGFSYEPEPYRGRSQYSSERHQAEGEECNRIAGCFLPEGFGDVGIVVLITFFCLVLSAVLGLGRHRGVP